MAILEMVNGNYLVPRISKRHDCKAMVTTCCTLVCMLAMAKFLFNSFVILSQVHSYLPCFTGNHAALG